MKIKYNAPEANIFMLMGMTANDLKSKGLKEKEANELTMKATKESSYERAINKLNEIRREYDIEEFELVFY